MSLRDVIDGGNSKAAKAFDLAIQVLIVISVITFSIDTLPDLSSDTTNLLSSIETITVTIFTIEYVARAYLAERTRDYVLSFYGIVDLLAIAPFYLSMGLDLRSIRILRMLRLFRIFKLARYNSAMRRLGKAFAIAKEEIVLFGVAMQYTKSVRYNAHAVGICRGHAIGRSSKQRKPVQYWPYSRQI